MQISAIWHIGVMTETAIAILQAVLLLLALHALPTTMFKDPMVLAVFYAITGFLMIGAFVVFTIPAVPTAIGWVALGSGTVALALVVTWNVMFYSPPTNNG